MSEAETRARHIDPHLLRRALATLFGVFLGVSGEMAI